MNKLNQAQEQKKQVQKKIDNIIQQTNSRTYFQHRFSGRMRNQEEAVKFEKWKKKIEKSGISLNSAICNALIEYIDNEEFNEVIDVVKERLHYYFRKAIFTSTKPIHNRLKHHFKYLNLRLDILDYKLNAILNIALNQVNAQLANREDINSKLYEESIAFIKMKKMISTYMDEEEAIDRKEEEQMSSNLNRTYKDLLDKHENNLDLKGMHKNEKNKTVNS
ncbi:Mbov_0398 family ICE element protein [Mycoplasma sp. 3686d]|uniref:Mbov_0398 family ICE element protein n=1 Tax=Mycoplasma sp. 3686d TaxID=2967300 RepID=UPI00211CCC6B|nr:hypothetical protein [Mycoplasma sp. 3686d]UUM24652.1 hypothetical protein NPA12_03070 [Mycoplasma sp. 3686d]